MSRPSPVGRVDRLTRTYEYQRVYKEGISAKRSRLQVYLRPCDDGRVKVGTSISRSIIKRAIDRNRLKRIIRGWFQQNGHAIRRSCEIVVVVKKKTPTNSAGSLAIRQGLSRLLREIRYLSR